MFQLTFSDSGMTPTPREIPSICASISSNSAGISTSAIGSSNCLLTIGSMLSRISAIFFTGLEGRCDCDRVERLLWLVVGLSTCGGIWNTGGGWGWYGCRAEDAQGVLSTSAGMSWTSENLCRLVGDVSWPARMFRSLSASGRLRDRETGGGDGDAVPKSQDKMVSRSLWVGI